MSQDLCFVIFYLKFIIISYLCSYDNDYVDCQLLSNELNTKAQIYKNIVFFYDDDADYDDDDQLISNETSMQ